jgi:hypothetical protein
LHEKCRDLPSGPLPQLKKIVWFFSHFFISRFAECRALSREGFVDRIFAETTLPRAALGKNFAENLRGFGLGKAAGSRSDCAMTPVLMASSTWRSA